MLFLLLLLSFKAQALPPVDGIQKEVVYDGKLNWILLSLKSNPKVFFWWPLHADSKFRGPLEEWAKALKEARSVDTKSDGCPKGMVRAQGKMLSPVITIPLQDKACLEKGNWHPGLLCQHFKEDYLQGKDIPFKNMDVCIDAYEFPNIPGEYPAVMLSFDDAQSLCAAEGKRLCTEDEWSFACEGEGASPYPHGLHRYTDMADKFPNHVTNRDGRNYDNLKITLTQKDIQEMLKNARKTVAGKLLDKGYFGRKSGEGRACVSAFGAYDMTGNIEEWAMSEQGRASVLKGGYWSPVRARCRYNEPAHGPGHRYYQTGFRCCQNP